MCFFTPKSQRVVHIDPGTGALAPAVYIGRLVTVRRYRMAENFLLELDEVSYPDGGLAHEVEIETPFAEEAREVLLAWIEKLGINARPQGRSKLQGLLERQGIDPLT